MNKSNSLCGLLGVFLLFSLASCEGVDPTNLLNFAKKAGTYSTGKEIWDNDFSGVLLKIDNIPPEYAGGTITIVGQSEGGTIVGINAGTTTLAAINVLAKESPLAWEAAMYAAIHTRLRTSNSVTLPLYVTTESELTYTPLTDAGTVSTAFVEIELENGTKFEKKIDWLQYVDNESYISIMRDKSMPVYTRFQLEVTDIDSDLIGYAVGVQFALSSGYDEGKCFAWDGLFFDTNNQWVNDRHLYKTIPESGEVVLDLYRPIKIIGEKGSGGDFGLIGLLSGGTANKVRITFFDLRKWVEIKVYESPTPIEISPKTLISMKDMIEVDEK